MTPIATFSKDPDAVLDYTWDWEDTLLPWLTTGETITSHTVTVSAGLTLDSSARSSNTVTAWISGGTAGYSEYVSCLIVTSEGRTDERTILLEVKER